MAADAVDFLSDVAGSDHALEEEANELGVHADESGGGGVAVVEVDKSILREEGREGR